MAGVVRGMLADIMPAFISNDTKAANDILQQDNMVDYLQRQTAEYLTRLAGGNLSLQQSEHAVQLLHVSTELEHIGDVIEKNMVALLIKKAEGNITFSEEGREELVEYHRRVLESYDHAIQAFDNEDIPLAHAVTTAKPELVQLEQVYRRTHYDRLSRELQASIESSQIHLDLIDYLRRVNSYAESIARTVLENL
jgi:phosphate:Na+ symporter